MSANTEAMDEFEAQQEIDNYLSTFANMSILLHPITGIYVLFNDDICIYVGASQRIVWRLSQHKSRIERDPSFYFNKVWIKVCPKSELEQEEYKAIQTFNPLYNKTHAGPRLVQRKSLVELKALLQK